MSGRVTVWTPERRFLGEAMWRRGAPKRQIVAALNTLPGVPVGSIGALVIAASQGMWGAHGRMGGRAATGRPRRELYITTRKPVSPRMMSRDCGGFLVTEQAVSDYARAFGLRHATVATVNAHRARAGFDPWVLAA